MSPPSAEQVRTAIDMAPQSRALERARARPPSATRIPSLSGPTPTSAQAVLKELHTRLREHSFWNNRLLDACRRQVLTREDYAYVFSGYALLASSADCFVHALLARCDSDLWRARLTQAFWEELGGLPPEKRPAELFRRFLRDGLGVEAESLHTHDATRYFVRECLDECLRSPPSAASAFLALGLQAPLPRLYSIFVNGLLQAGVPERHLPFFYRKMELDSVRASTLEQLVLSYAHEPGWSDTCLRAMERALELQGHLLESLFEAVRHRRLGPLLEHIQARLPLAPERPAPSTVHQGGLSHGTPFYRHVYELCGIDFTLDKVSFPTEVLETNVLRVAPGHRSEPREHAHEALLVVLSGTGSVHVRDTAVDVKPGDIVFVPRWTSHQAHSTGAEPLALLMVTDHGLTRRALEEEVLCAARLKRATGVVL